MKKTKSKIFVSGLSIFLACSLWPTVAPALDNAECLECHSDESLYRSSGQDINNSFMNSQLFVDQARFEESVHHLNGIGCIDCHADIELLDYEQETPHPANLQPVDCTGCHQEEGEGFLSSSHAAARKKGIIMLCHACHDHHYSRHQEASSVTERENAMCLRCHNPFQAHGWLPQKNAHFEHVECTACHAPEVPHHFHLTFYDLVTNRFMKGSEVLKTLDLKPDQFLPLIDVNNDGTINAGEMDTLVLILRQKQIRVVFHAELLAEMHPSVHQVSSTGARRDCESCHSPYSQFFQAVTIAMDKGDGTVDHYQVDRSVLESYHTSHFYALAGTRVRLLDKMGLGFIAGGVLVVTGHLTTRIATLPLRRRNKKQTGKGGRHA